METRAACKTEIYICPVFGEAKPLINNKLPTFEEVMKCYEFHRFNIKQLRKTIKEPLVLEICEIVAHEVEELWVKASVPTVCHKRVLQLIKTYHTQCKNILKFKRSEQKKEEFLKKSRVLFDICSCKCKQIQNCCCPKERKVPKVEHQFLIDQRKNRKMVIGGIDTKETAKLQKKRNRSTAQNVNTVESAVNVSMHYEQESFSSSNDSSAGETSFNCLEENELPNDEPPKAQAVKSQTIKCKSFPTLALVCDRYGVSDRAAAAIASAVLHDTSSDCCVIDKSRLRRAKKKNRAALLRNEENLDIDALYFDGRKDKTLKIVRNGAKNYRQEMKEEHISVLHEPGSRYLGYASPVIGSAKGIEESIRNLLVKKKVNLNNLGAIGCDGTAVNTGKHNGVIRLFEKTLQRPLQWIICMFHFNELPLRHLFNKLDGTTVGPSSSTGPIAKLMESCEKLPVTSFKAIFSKLPDIQSEIISTDQKYLYDITNAVIHGNCPADLALRTPGMLSHARWLTKANRILRLYVATLNPTDNLMILAEFVVKVYAPIWFEIKTNSKAIHGSKNLWKLIKYSRYLPIELKTIIDPVIQRNAYFAHAENILLAMLWDDEQKNREIAVGRIMKTRSFSNVDKNPRIFEVPKINFNAINYHDMIDWGEDVTEPPVLRTILNDELNSYVQSLENKTPPFLELPCHTQAVERTVKLVTEASSKICDEEARDGFIKATLASRQLMPNFESKQDFVGKL